MVVPKNKSSLYIPIDKTWFDYINRNTDVYQCKKSITIMTMTQNQQYIRKWLYNKWYKRIGNQGKLYFRWSSGNRQFLKKHLIDMGKTVGSKWSQVNSRTPWGKLQE